MTLQPPRPLYSLRSGKQLVFFAFVYSTASGQWDHTFMSESGTGARWIVWLSLIGARLPRCDRLLSTNQVQTYQPLWSVKPDLIGLLEP